MLAIVGLPLLLVGTLELCLRIAGFGRPTTFFVPVTGSGLFTSNQSFGERFFPAPIARTPPVVVFEVPKPAPTFRVFVLGGSAGAACSAVRCVHAMPADSNAALHVKVYSNKSLKTDRPPSFDQIGPPSFSLRLVSQKIVDFPMGFL